MSLYLILLPEYNLANRSHSHGNYVNQLVKTQLVKETEERSI